jgi:hypothetical protein
MSLPTCDNIWLKRLVLHFCPSHFMFVKEMLPTMVIKTMHVLLGLAKATTLLVSFDL